MHNFVSQIRTMRRIRLLIFFSLLYLGTAYGQVLQGTIKNSSGNPIPFSTVFVRELSLGAAANIEGNFELNIPQGRYECVFQSLGYQPVIQQVEVNASSQPLVIVLSDMVYDLSMVEISGRIEDPAYRIIRKVISKAPEYAGMVRSFKAGVYIKGSAQIKSISSLVKWMAKDDLKEMDIKVGDIYLEESVNEIEFTAPNNTKQKVISINSTFPGFSDNRSSNAMGFISGNIYQPNGFGAAFSPIHTGAFKYYRYRYEGKTKFNNREIHKIAILPKGKGSQYVQGTIYIVDGLWCVSNFAISKEEQLGVTLALTQNYEEVREGAWLPVSNRLELEMDLLGNSGSFNYHTSIRYNELVVNVPGSRKSNSQKVAKTSPDKVSDQTPADGLAQVPSNASERSKMKQKQKQSAFHEKTKARIEEKQVLIDRIALKEDINTAESYKLARLKQKQEELRIKDSLRYNHEFVETYITEIDSNARKQDTSYWNRIRPIPLTVTEMTGIRAADSLSVKKRKLETDSIGSPRKSNWPMKLLFSGTIRDDSLFTIHTRGLVNPFSLGYNVVDGLSYNTGFLVRRFLPDKRSVSLQPMLGYAFASKSVFWEILGLYKVSLVKRQIGLKFGQQTFDYNNDATHPFESAIAALIFRENPGRFYRASYLELQYETELPGGFSVSSGMFFNENSLLDNTTNYSFFYKGVKEFEPNIPDNPDYLMTLHQDFSAEVTLKYKAVPYYFIKDGMKIPYYRFDNSPEFSLTWRKGIPVGIFDTDYDLVKVAMYQQQRLGLSDRLNYRFEAGYFINTKSMWFTQFQHFAKRPLVAGIKEFFPYFLMLNSYVFSTNEHYAVAHLQYKSPFILLKRLPIIRNRMWTESLFFSYLYTPQNKNYLEPGYGIGGLFFNIGVFAGFQGFTYQQVGVRMAFTIFGTKEISF